MFSQKRKLEYIHNYRMFEKKMLIKFPKLQTQKQKKTKQGDKINKQRYPINLLEQ